MTAAALLDSLRARRVELVAAGDRLRYRPVESVTADELEALRACKAELLALLRAEATGRNDGWAGGVRSGPCGLCCSPLAWVQDWPMARDARWHCATCAAWPAPTLAEVFATLTADERRRLDDEARAGDGLARVIVAALVGIAGGLGCRELGEEG
jgi:hypothetical protein